MYYIIKSTINSKKLDDITHEIIGINCDRKDIVVKFNSYTKGNVPKKYKLCDNNMKLMYNDNNFIITIQVLEYHDDSKDIFAEFIDDSDSELIGDNNNLLSANIDECLKKINTLVDKSKKDTLQITDNFNNIISKYKNMHETKIKSKSLILKF